MSFVVAVDGPSGTGKGTISKLISQKFNFQYLDTGAMYRCVALELINQNVQITELDKIKEILGNIKIDFEGDKVFLNKEDVTGRIREQDVTAMSSKVATVPIVRTKMVELQRRISEGKDIVLDGRDIGTVVFPNAEVKIYLDATSEERAKRRYKQNQEKGIDTPFEEVKKSIELRDKTDSERETSPLKQAEDAIYIDTTNVSIRKVEKKVCKIVKKEKEIAERIERGYHQKPETTWKKIQRTCIRGVLKTLYKIVYRPRLVRFGEFT